MTGTKPTGSAPAIARYRRAMLRPSLLPALLLLAAALPAAAAPQQPAPTALSVVDAVQQLKPGGYLWAPQIAPAGPMMVVVSLKLQRAYVYRNGVIIGVSTVSSGAKGHETPTGVFTVLQKAVDHKSNLYNDAPMPFMQRLTWDGIAMHAGKLPGYPASHGCIRLPLAFARLLYGTTSRGMTVVITDGAPVPRVAPTPQLLTAGKGPRPAAAAEPPSWQPEKAPTGPLSIIVSAADRRVVVLRNGVEIGSAPVAIRGAIPRPAAYVVGSVDAAGAHWIKLALPWDRKTDAAAPADNKDRIAVDSAFRDRLAPLLVAGTTVVVTPDSLSSGSTGAPVTLLEDSEG
ncbi:L,D-transpeptidase [Sphingomonas sp. ac-8]|uniref:L,D-transpeptidase n=1 Tax=Sphingomonas sp. ac-8 TaxID=3242977 RepID=UPI003A8028AE